MFVKLLVSLLAVGGVGTAIVLAAAPDTPSAEQAVVTHLVDGDTFDVSVDGRSGEMARAGLAKPVVFGGNDRFYPPVLAARDEAASQRRGLFSPNVACTLPGRLEAVSTAVTQATTAAAQPANASSTGLDTAAAAAATVVAAAKALEGAFAGDRSGHVWAVFTQDEQDRLAQQVTGLREKAQREVTVLRNAALTADATEVAARTAEEISRVRE